MPTPRESRHYRAVLTEYVPILFRHFIGPTEMRWVVETFDSERGWVVAYETDDNGERYTLESATLSARLMDACRIVSLYPEHRDEQGISIEAHNAALDLLFPRGATSSHALR